MNILYTCDNNYIWIMGISTISLLENNKHIKDLTIYLLGEDISDENKKILLGVGNKYKRNVVIIDVPNFDIPESLVSARWPLSAFTRLFCGILLPAEIKRILYLDCDTIITGDIAGLDKIELEDKMIFGVKDCIGYLYKMNIGLKSKDPYINAGILLVNLVELRKINVEKLINEYMKSYEKLINYADQDVLNGVFKGRIGILQLKYDVMTIDVMHSYKEIHTLRHPNNFYKEAEFKEAVNKPTIIHYTTNMRVIRPWYTNTNHPLASTFKQYMKLSPWSDKKLSKMVFSSRESKVIGLIDRLPKCISCRLLGLIHSVLKPLYISLKARK